MNWKFWQRKDEQEEVEIENLQTEVQKLQHDLEELSHQLKKMTRMQFKSSKTTEEKLDELRTEMTELNQLRKEIQNYENSQGKTIHQFIQLIDELDRVATGLSEKESYWYKVLQQWTGQLLNNLAEMGVQEISVMGETFNPRLTEAVQTVPNKESTQSQKVPYQIIEVIQRGYVDKEKKLLRKAKVITLEGVETW